MGKPQEEASSQTAVPARPGAMEHQLDRSLAVYYRNLRWHQPATCRNSNMLSPARAFGRLRPANDSVGDGVEDEAVTAIR